MLGFTMLKTFDCPKCKAEIAFRICIQKVCHKCGNPLPDISGLIELIDDRILYSSEGKAC